MPNIDVVSRLRQPQYTGENRCIPCTVVNSVITIGLGFLIAGAAVVAGVEVLVGALLGIAILGIGAASIYLRGYLIPGTPRLTQRYFPAWLLRHFDKGPSHSTDQSDEFDAEAILTDSNVVTECDREDDLCLTESFSRAWREAMDRRRETDASIEELASLIGTEVDQLEVETFDEAFVATQEGRRIGQWESEAAFVADMAAAATLPERIATWDDIPLHERSHLLRGLRAFLESCPMCGGSIVMNETEVTSCCRSIDVLAMNCTECDSRLLETEHPG